jgi:hypothetical protein
MDYLIARAPAIRLAVASKAACIFSLTVSLASRRALPPPRISFIIRKRNYAICLVTVLSIFKLEPMFSLSLKTGTPPSGDANALHAYSRPGAHWTGRHCYGHYGCVDRDGFA